MSAFKWFTMMMCLLILVLSGGCPHSTDSSHEAVTASDSTGAPNNTEITLTGMQLTENHLPTSEIITEASTDNTTSIEETSTTTAGLTTDSTTMGHEGACQDAEFKTLAQKFCNKCNVNNVPMCMLGVCLVTTGCVEEYTLLFECSTATCHASDCPDENLKALECLAEQAACNNGIIEVGEKCEADNLLGFTCESFGSFGGTLSCDTNCHFDKSQCPPPCGDGFINKNTGEECDPGCPQELECDPESCEWEPSGECGDGVINPINSNLQPEICDDGNTLQTQIFQSVEMAWSMRVKSVTTVNSMTRTALEALLAIHPASWLRKFALTTSVVTG